MPRWGSSGAFDPPQLVAQEDDTVSTICPIASLTRDFRGVVHGNRLLYLISAQERTFFTPRIPHLLPPSCTPGSRCRCDHTSSWKCLELRPTSGHVIHHHPKHKTESKKWTGDRIAMMPICSCHIPLNLCTVPRGSTPLSKAHELVMNVAGSLSNVKASEYIELKHVNHRSFSGS